MSNEAFIQALVAFAVANGAIVWQAVKFAFKTNVQWNQMLADIDALKEFKKKAEYDLTQAHNKIRAIQVSKDVD